MGASPYNCSGDITLWLLPWLQLKQNCAFYSVLVSNLSSEIITFSTTLKSVSQWTCLVCPIEVETGRPLIGLLPLALQKLH